MARLLNAFTFDDRVSARVSNLSDADLAILLGPPPAVKIVMPAIDIYGLTAENYEALYNMLGLPPAREPRPGPLKDFTAARTKIDRTPDWAHYLEARRCYVKDQATATLTHDTMLNMRRTNRKAVTVAQRAASRMPSRTVNRSRIVEALIVLGLETLAAKKEEAARRGSERSQEGDAGPVEVKRARRGRRAQAVA